MKGILIGEVLFLTILLLAFDCSSKLGLVHRFFFLFVITKWSLMFCLPCRITQMEFLRISDTHSFFNLIIDSGLCWMCSQKPCVVFYCFSIQTVLLVSRCVRITKSVLSASFDWPEFYYRKANSSRSSVWKSLCAFSVALCGKFIPVSVRMTTITQFVLSTAADSCELWVYLDRFFLFYENPAVRRDADKTLDSIFCSTWTVDFTPGILSLTLRKLWCFDYVTSSTGLPLSA